MNKFKFRGVGQGLFYTGSLMHGTYNFVYDCGSESRNFYLKKQIEEYIEEMRDSINTKPHIDFIVVSHLHKDHINGIYDLLTKCSVDKLYLPYIMGDDTFKRFVLAYIAFYDLEGKNNNDFGDNIEEDNEQRRRELYKILKTLYGIEENRLDINTQVIITGENNATAPIEFCFPNNKKKYWEFKIFQRHLNEEIISDLNFEIKSLMKKCGHKSYNDSDIIDFILHSKKKIEELASEYEDIFGRKNKYGLQGGLNISSLVLVHYPQNSVQDIEYKYYNRLKSAFYYIDIYQNSNKNITVLTGDAVLDKEFTQALDFINDEENKNNILFLQVPHHGSSDNWEYINNLDLHARGFILSFGLGNKHGHPHAKTIYDLRDKLYYCVTQDQSFEYIID